MKKKLFGKLHENTPVYSYRLENGEIFAEIITFGAAINKFGFLDGKETNLVGSFDTLDGYLTDDSHQGAIIGRVANRIENAKFTIKGKTYCLPKNDGENCLHGGNGFDRRIWEVIENGKDYIVLRYYSEDGEEGFPGGLDVTVKYTLAGTALVIEYKAIPEKKTPIALTNHAYFNLDGMGGDILSHKVQIFAEKYTEADENLIPTGKHPSVDGTVFDLRTPKEIGEGISQDFLGYDHNFVLSPTEFDVFCGKKLGLAANVSTESTLLSVYTDMGDMQFYIGNFLEGKPDFAGGIKRIIHGAFCLETQTEPNAVNSGIGIYAPGEIYSHTTAFRLKKLKKD